jgi:hypothetical protein
MDDDLSGIEKNDAVRLRFGDRSGEGGVGILLRLPDAGFRFPFPSAWAHLCADACAPGSSIGLSRRIAAGARRAISLPAAANRPRMAPQRLENIGFAPENGMALKTSSHNILGWTSAARGRNALALTARTSSRAAERRGDPDGRKAPFVPLDRHASLAMTTTRPAHACGQVEVRPEMAPQAIGIARNAPENGAGFGGCGGIGPGLTARTSSRDAKRRGDPEERGAPVVSLDRHASLAMTTERPAPASAGPASPANGAASPWNRSKRARKWRG